MLRRRRPPGSRWPGALLVLAAAVAGCHVHGDDGVPVPSSSWSWVCGGSHADDADHDGTPAPDAGCPTEPDGGGADGGAGDGDGS